MNAVKLFTLVWQSIRRNKRDFLFSSIGIIIGISTLLFFTALGTGIKDTVLEEVFMVRQIEVIKKSYDVGAFQSEGLFGAKQLDDDLVDRLSKLDGVVEVTPKMKLTFPTGAYGGKELIGKNIRAELVADGIPASFITDDEVSGDLAFQDWEHISCEANDACPGGYMCGDEGLCAGSECAIPRGAKDDPVCEGASYCHRGRGVCTMPIPVVVSPQLLEIYNGSIHTALQGTTGPMSKLPKLSKQALIGFQGNAVFGKSFFLGASAKGEEDVRRMQLVGFTPKAINLGVTMPIGYVKRLNAKYNKDEGAASEYHSIVVETASNEVTAQIASRVEEMGYALSDRFENAQRASLLILLITLVFNLIAAIILAVAAVNIMHTFLMLILERRRELGLMRALGATRRQIQVMVLSEATVLGLIGGSLGAGIGVVATLVVDAIFASQVQDFPFKPESLFVYEPWMFGVCLGSALLFCWIGAALPALRASRIDPASALTGR